jgi:hypothetical protein
MAHRQHKFIQEKKPEGGSPARELQPTVAYRLGFIGQEGLGKGWGIFPLWLVHCPLLGVVKEVGLVFCYRLGNRMFQSQTHGKNGHCWE